MSDVGPEHLALMLETKPEVVSFHFGLPEPEIVRALKSAGIFILSSATTVAEARLLEERGVDAIIAQGTEAGGHRATFTDVSMSMQPGLFSLLPQVVDAVRVPVIAAGGVADGRTAAAAFMLGASAVQVGTAFLRCEEADMRDAHRAALAEADDACTVVTDLISGRPCPLYPQQADRRSCRIRAEAAADPGATEPDRAARRHRKPRMDSPDVRATGGACTSTRRPI